MEFIREFIYRTPGAGIVFLALAVFIGLFAVVSLSLSKLLRPSNPHASKAEPYECGVEPDAPMPDGFALRYAGVAILFLLFDIELIFLYPWAVYHRSIGGSSLISMTVFLAVLMAGYVIVWKKGAFRWK